MDSTSASELAENPDDRRLRVGEPFPKQREFLECDRLKLGSDGLPTIRRINYVGGRGSAKTTAGIIDLIMVADRMPGLITAWREPRWSDVERVFLTALRDMLPEQWGFWRLVRREGHKFIEWRNGHLTHLLSRQVDDPGKRIALGSNYAGVWEDEAADRFGRDKMIDIQNAIRDRRAPYLFHITLSTPTVGAYEAWCRIPGSTTIHATSYDNPYIAQSVIDEWRHSMSPELWAQEVLGQFVPQAGRVWTTFREEQWPRGNILEDYEFDPGKPWYLSCDLGGAQSAFGIWQYVNASAIGGRGGQRLAVLVAEYCPNHIGLGAVLDDICRNYGGGWSSDNTFRRPPVAAYVGSDVASPGTNGVTGGQVFHEMGLDYVAVTGERARKDLQRSAALSMILVDSGERQLAVAARRGSDGQYEMRQHFGEGKSRGFLNVMRSDTYPPVSSKDLFWKDKGQRGINALEDDRDQFLYFAVCEFPPVWGLGGKRPVELVS